ncbi:MAG: ketoacyl-ACP synthase III [Candidatus Lustribacter sp.]|jgi:3-oxoacyl-[acyl-carrier-protein] synthase-3
MVHPSAASVPRARVADIATYVPEGRLTNADLAKMLDTSDEWIVQRTGIRERSIAADDEFASDLCLEAVRRLRDRVGPFDRVDAVIAATSTADYVFPSLAAQIQYGANLPHAGAFDVGAACAGWPYALNLAAAMVVSEQAREVLVVGGEVMTKALDYTDRSTCILFGDGAGAALVVAGDARSYIERTSYGCDGEGGKYLYRTSIRHDIAGHEDATGMLRQSGADVYKWAVRRISEAILELLAAANLGPHDVDWFVPHSANLRIVEALCARTGIPRERTLTSIENYGNTSTASIPLALMPALEAGRIKRGDRILMYGFGGGLVHAGTLLRW